MVKYIRNGYVIDPAGDLEGYYDIAIKNGHICDISETGGEAVKSTGETDDSNTTKTNDSKVDNIEVIDASGCIVAPGLIDIHVHFRDPGFTHKEDMHTGAGAAAAGGFTTVVLMANTKPVVDDVETLRYVLEKAAEEPIHILSAAAVTKGLKGKEPVDMKALLNEGAAFFTDDGIPILDKTMAEQVMEMAAENHTLLSFHEEDASLITNNGVNKGQASDYYQIQGSPRKAEVSMVERDIELSRKTGAAIHIQHISAAESVELVRKGKKDGLAVTAEATPHHFSCTETLTIEKGTLAKMNPPLRTELDRLAIVEGLRDGTIDVIATDHAPHSSEEKAKPITEAPSGIIGLETSLSLGLSMLVEQEGFSVRQLLKKMTANPAKLLHLDNRGSMKIGAYADFVVFDREERTVGQHFYSKSENSPFIGRKLSGNVRYTICEGNIVFAAEDKSVKHNSYQKQSE